MRGIGEMARASGLSVSALRFYDGAGVLVPAEVDPVTGYRRYADGQLRAARLVASLRRVGMPIAGITAALAALADPAAVRALLADHLRRLEDGLADARRELSHAHALLLDLERPMTRVTLQTADLAAAIAAVRFAVGTDPELPMLGGILFEASAGTLTLVATDRFRLAVAAAPATVDGPPIRVTVPADLVDRAFFPHRTGDLVLSADHVAFGDVEGKPMDVDFPDWRRLIGEPGERRVTVEASALREALAAQPELWREHDGTTYPVSVLGLDQAGALRLTAEAEWAADQDAHVAVNREFLLQALDAGGAGQLVLELDGPIKPLVVRAPGTDRFSLLMPVRH